MTAPQRRPSQVCTEPRGWCYDPLGLTTYGHREGCLQHPTWGRHHWHSESDCCVCADNPCSTVDVRFVLDHERREAKSLAEAVDRAIEYAITHGHREPDPFDLDADCPPTCRKGSWVTYNREEHLASLVQSGDEKWLTARKETSVYLQEMYADNLAFERAVHAVIEAEQARRAAEKRGSS